MSCARVSRLTGSVPSKNPLARLTNLYVFIDRLLVKCPEESVYKKNTEAIIEYRKSILQSTQCIEEIECMVNCGTMEQLIRQAENELNLLKTMLKYKPWEPLVGTPPADQWKWPVSNYHT